MSKKNITPRGKYVLVKQAEPESRENEFGLLVPDSEEQEQKAQGDVIAVGSEVKGLKKGDRIIYGAYAGETLKVNEGTKEVEYKLLHDDDIIAFIS